MTDSDLLASRFPALHDALPRLSLATLPTPVGVRDCTVDGVDQQLTIKYDNLTGERYGGNKVRKLEYILPRASARRCARIATFGAAGSNHALATAIYARASGFDCTCFLSHQAKTPLVADTLRAHLRIGTELVRYGGAYAQRLATLREHLWGRAAWVIPMGGSSWLGTVGFVVAGLELAEQLDRREAPVPDRLYVGSGTMGTAAGIAIGLALAGLDTEVQAVRVSDVSIMNREALDRLVRKTATMLRRHDDTIPADLVERIRIRVRDAFFAPGYARGTELTDEAIAFAGDAFDLELETTYTGKTMAALLSDWRSGDAGNAPLYWHTYNSAKIDTREPASMDKLPAEFRRYFED
jgi:1-aminocyclopropane-1-carboxylate deaminase/D-cysteine desulfhydrase-like pyridoxal-dependent ACC family enzyme